MPALARLLIMMHVQAKLGWSAEETASMDVSEHINLPHPRQLPPHNGFGSEEDSAQNCISLVQAPQPTPWQP